MENQIVKKKIGESTVVLQEGIPVGTTRVWYRDTLIIPADRVSIQGIEQMVDSRQALDSNASRQGNDDGLINEINAEVHRDADREETEIVGGDTSPVTTKSLSLF